MKRIHTDAAPAAIGPYAQATTVGNMVFTSGQLPINPETKAIPETAAEQCLQSLANVKSILAAEGLTLNNVMKATVFLSDLNDFVDVNKAYESAFADCDGFPARTAIEVARLPLDVKVEIEVIAMKS